MRTRFYLFKVFPLWASFFCCFVLVSVNASAAQPKQTMTSQQCQTTLVQLKKEFQTLKESSLAMKSYLDNAEANLLTLDTSLKELESNNADLKKALIESKASLTAARTDYLYLRESYLKQQSELTQERHRRKTAIITGIVVGVSLAVVGAVGVAVVYTGVQR